MKASHQMLSIGKPPRDPTCTCDELIAPLKSDECASTSSQLPDLIPSPSLPDFSIRNYVFAARSEDIGINWPFSQRSLQLCLKCGVKDPLPPFQSLDNVRKLSFQGSSVKTSCSFKKEINRSNPTEEQLRLDDNEDDNIPNDGLAGNNFPSTTTSTPNNESASIQIENFLATSAEKEVSGFTNSRKTETAVRPAGKKDWLIVKPGDLEQSLTKDIDSTSAAVSEMMASKVCPVCKTFSSSSNTTLNAHIDQCLSEEPTAKWSAGSKLIRRRIKPRKTRLMVDIYETASQSTLEDLDRRNRLNWVTETTFPSKDTAEEKKRRVSVNPDRDVGAVYVDSNGTKLRILSKFTISQPSSSRVGEALGPRKCTKGRGNKVLLSKKKRKNKKGQKARNHKKCLKLVSQSEDFSSDKAQLHGSQVDFSGQDKYHEARAGSEDTRLLVSTSQGFLQTSDHQTLKQWACSKRSGAPKKAVDKHQHPPLGFTLHVAQDLLVEHEECFANNLISGGHDSYSSEDPRSSEGRGAPVIEGESPGKRKLSPSFYGCADGNVEESNFPIVKRRVSQSSGPFKSTRGCAFHGRNKMIISSIAYENSSKSDGISPAEAVRFSGVEKNLPSVSSLRRSKLDDAKNLSIPERSEMHLVEDMNEDDREDDLDPSPKAKTNNKMFLSGRHAGGFEQDTRKTCAFQELQYSDSEKGMNAESSVSLSNDQSEWLDGLDFVVNTGQDREKEDDDDIGAFELQSKLGTKDNASNFSKYLNQGNSVKDRRIHTQSSIEIYKGTSGPIENQSFPGIIRDVGDGTNQPCSDVNMDADTHVQKEYEVERILIPGPPGSFLPSPGALGSEDCQGNSSLTTSRVQSSHEHQDLVYGDSSDSPISAASTVSNSAPAGFETKSLGPQLLEGKASSASSSGCRGIKPLMSIADSIPQPSTMGVSSERKSIEKDLLILKNNDQPCCCQRKERGSQGIISNYLESQLLRRNSGCLSLIAMGNHPYQSSNTTAIHVDGAHEPLTRSAAQDFKSEISRLSSVPVTLKGFDDTGAKVSHHSGCISAASSVSNPVLRLMGKNLMVVNKGEDASTSLGLSQSASGTRSNNPSSSQVLTTDISYSSIPISLSSYSLAQYDKLKMVMEPPAVSSGMSINWHASGCSDDTPQILSQPLRNNAVVSESQVSRPMKEVIIIDDTQEDEISYMPADNVRQVGVLTERQASAAPVLPFAMKTTVSYDPRLAGTFPCNYPSQDTSLYGPMPISMQAASSGIGVQWCSSPEGPGAFQRGPLMGAPSQEVHFRSPLPYSPSR